MLRLQHCFQSVHKLTILAALIFACCSPASSQTTTLAWKFWGTSDGLGDATSSWITIDQTGVAWAKHGGMGQITRLDGYGLSFLPDPHEGGRLVSAPDGDLWLLKNRALHRYRGGKWQSWTLPELSATPPKNFNANDRDPFAALGGGRLLFLLPDRILGFDANTSVRKIFRLAAASHIGEFITLFQGRDKQIHVTGKYGVATIGPSLEWKEFRAPAELADFEQPREGDDGEMFLSASRAGRQVVVRFDGKSWDVVYTGLTHQVAGWRGADRDLWVRDGDRISRLTNGWQETVDRTDALAGIVQNVVPGAAGTFWVLTTQGIARYSPPLWRTPAAVRGPAMDTLVNAICEDGNGTIWFAGNNLLISYDSKQWKQFAVPARAKFSVASLPDTLRSFPDGRVALITGTDEVLVFHPDSEHFEMVRHPSGRYVRLFGSRRNGGLLVQTVDPADAADFRLETFDGTSFQPFLQLADAPQLQDLRAIHETAGGDLWLGSIHETGIYRGGKYRPFGIRDGYTQGGAFALAETADGRMLAGGRDSLDEFDGRQWRTLRKSLDRVRALVPGQDGRVWAASGTGVHNYKDGRWITNGAEEGLPSSVSYKVFEDSRGRVWAGTTRGLSLYHPDADSDAPRTIAGEELNLHEATPDGTVRIVFSGVDKWKLTPEERLLYSSRLDSGAWGSFDSKPVASYRALSAGRHRFEVRAMDRNGNVDPHPARFDFSVMLPWYRQSAFVGVASIAVFVIFGLLYLTYLSHLTVVFQSEHDPLTRLSNRRVFDRNLTQAVDYSSENNSRVAVLLLDLDGFKPVNDTFGHAVGDLFLQEVADRLRKCVRQKDTVARIGGDEFAVVMADIKDQSDAEFLARRILDQLRLPFRVENHELRGSCSIGVSLYPDHTEEVSHLQRLADAAMYVCKNREKNNFFVFEPGQTVL